MKNLLFVVAVVAACMNVSCSKEKNEGNVFDSQNVKLVNQIKITRDYEYEGTSNLKTINLVYDNKNRIIKYDDMTFSYEGNTMTVDRNYYDYNEHYTCELDANGYVIGLMCEYGDDYYSGKYETKHTYQNGYLTSCEYVGRDMFVYKWDNGNISSISSNKEGTTYFTYGTYENTPINLDLFYITDDYGCYDGYNLGFLGFLGRQNKYLPIKYGNYDFSYEFNSDGTVSKVMLGNVYIELYY